MARSADYLGATGIGVSDLKRSAAFYVRALGMKEMQTFKLDYMDEIVLGHEGRSAVVLMHYTDGSARNYKDNPIKLVFYVADPKAVAARIRAEGCEIVREPTPLATFGNTVVGLAKDPDGYIIELLQAPAPKPA
ncbi:MAG TPA: VOC family protein [Rhizomicrobium sp.]|jgi:lactoylglutathione lyase|nr:VOC family protein [Rhizomicrobium sp.]